jgi:hypothetical protein
LLPLPDDGFPSRHLGRRQSGREALERGCGQFGEQRSRAQQRDLHDRDGCLGVQAGRRGAPAPAPALRRSRGREGEPFNQAEHLSQRLSRDRTLQQRPASDVQKGAARADQRQQRHGSRQAQTGRNRRQRAAQRQRGAQDRHTQAPADQQHADRGRQDRAHPVGGVQVTGPRLRAAQDRDGQDDKKAGPARRSARAANTGASSAPGTSRTSATTLATGAPPGCRRRPAWQSTSSTR